MKKIYMVGNTHFDPVWLWRWDEAMSSIIATFRSALARMEEYPDFTVISTSARTKKSTRPDKGLTFEKMALYIGTFKNADELMEIFETVKIRAKVTASSKKYVTDSVKAQFPNYNSAIVTEPS